MLFNHVLFLSCARIVAATPWNGYHNYHAHYHEVKLASSNSALPEASPLVPGVLLQAKREITPATSLVERQEEEEDECSDEDEDGEEDSGQQSGFLAAGNAGGNITTTSAPTGGPAASSSSASTSTSTQYNGAPVGGSHAFYISPDIHGGSGLTQPFSNVSFPHPQVIQPATSGDGESRGSDTVNSPTSGEGEAQQDGVVNNGIPVLPNLQSTSAAAAQSSSPPRPPPPPSPDASSSAPAAAAPSTAGSGNVDLAVGAYKASFTNYGAGDADGSGSCNTATSACGFYNSPGFNAAVSQALFGVGPGAGAGPACGNCYKLMPDEGESIVVKVNNLCPDDGNPLCAYPVDVDVNFDLCIQDGAGPTMFNGIGTQQVNGTAVQVSCAQWTGSPNLTS